MFNFFENDYTKFWNDIFFVSNADVFVENVQENVASVNKAGKLVLEGLQTASQRQSEIAKRSFGDAADAAISVTKAEAGREQLVAGADQAQIAIKKSLNDARELNEMILKSQRDAIKTISEAMLGNIELFKRNIAS